MSSVPQISVCLPTYNRSGPLARIVHAFLGQRFDDFEIVISDDASTDDTQAVLKSFTDPRVRCFRQETNLGIMKNWDFSVRQARAPLVFRLDDDDYVAPSFLEKACDFYKRHPEVGSLYTSYGYTRTYDAHTDLVVRDRGLFNEREVVSSEEFLRAFLLHDPFPGIHPAAVVFRRAAAEAIGFYRPEFSDHVFTLALATQAPVGYLPELLFYYVQHDQARASNTTRNGDVYYDPLNLAKSVYESGWDFFDQDPTLSRIRDQVYRRHLRVYSCVELYTVKRNFKSRRLVLSVAGRLLREHPSLAIHPGFFGALAACLGPDGWTPALLEAYRNSRWLQKLAR
ncbi:MAG: glycosyltransferase family 2 protein [Verrucomicrobiae bacterium]|nr:glycosyltransferase family 2 protein [Verrucomicrobiae bacterium]